MAEFGADLVFNPQFDEHPQGHTAQQQQTVDSPWLAVEEPDQPQPIVRSKVGKPLQVENTERASRYCHLSNQSFGPSPSIIVSHNPDRAWIMLYNDGLNDAWIAETESQLSVVPPLGYHLPSGASVVLPTQAEMWCVSPSSTTVNIATGINGQP